MKTCLFCRESDGLSTILICRECLSSIRQQSIIENHHIFGKNHSPVTLPYPANLHALITHKQGEWPKVFFQKTDNPLLTIARFLRVIADTCAVFSHVAYRYSEWLLAASSIIESQIGTHWSESLAPLDRKE